MPVKKSFSNQRFFILRFFSPRFFFPLLFATLLTACSTLPHTTAITNQPIANINQNQLTGKLVFILEQGKGKDRHSYLVTSQLDGSQAKILTQVVGTLSNLSASQDGNILIFTEQQTSFPRIFRYDVTTGKKTLLTPQQANHFSGAISPNNQKILLSSSMNQNPEIFLADSDGSHLEQLTHDKAVDIAPFWSPDGRWFIFTSDRTGLYHPQLYRYDFATAHTTQLATTGGYNANAKISPNGELISYISKQDDRIKRVLKNLNTGQMWIMDDNLSEAMSFSPDGNNVVYSTQSAIAIARLPNPTNPIANKANINQEIQQITPIYQLDLANIDLPKNSLSMDDLSNAIVREPIWVK